MYRMSSYEVMQYEIAANQLEKLRHEHAIELQNAYEDISPTMTTVNYSLGEIFVESVDPSEYAIYLIELREQHERSERWWALRTEAYSKALESLSKKELQDLTVYHPGNFAAREQAKKKVNEALSEIVSINPELQYKSVCIDEIEDVEEADRIIDNMNDDELFKDYWSLDEQLEKEGITEKCIKLRNVHEMTYNGIGKQLGITSFRAKQIVLQAN